MMQKQDINIEAMDADELMGFAYCLNMRIAKAQAGASQESVQTLQAELETVRTAQAKL